MALSRVDKLMRDPNVLDIIGAFCNFCFYVVAPLGCIVGIALVLLDLVGLI